MQWNSFLSARCMRKRMKRTKRKRKGASFLCDLVLISKFLLLSPCLYSYSLHYASPRLCCVRSFALVAPMQYVYNMHCSCVDVMLLCSTASECAFMNEKLGVKSMYVCLSVGCCWWWRRLGDIPTMCESNCSLNLWLPSTDEHCHATTIVWEFFTGGAMRCYFYLLLLLRFLPSYTHLFLSIIQPSLCTTKKKATVEPTSVVVLTT